VSLGTSLPKQEKCQHFHLHHKEKKNAHPYKRKKKKKKKGPVFLKKRETRQANRVRGGRRNQIVFCQREGEK